MSDPRQAMAILASADIIHSAETVAAAVSRVAREISRKAARQQPGAAVRDERWRAFCRPVDDATDFSARLRLRACHALRPGNRGGALSWRAEPSTPVSGRTLLLVDDILDEGLTLAAIRERLLQRGADACYTAVLADKLIGRKKPIAADFVALTVPDRFLFGYGMDVRGAWRNLPAIYAMRED
jgi:hypoxanthine phosphoribosyltransferase